MLERAQGGAIVLREEKTGGLYSLPGVLLAAGLYSVLHITARLIASGNLGEDDPLDAILTQTLALGYIPGQPPLYDWASVAHRTGGRAGRAVVSAAEIRPAHRHLWVHLPVGAPGDAGRCALGVSVGGGAGADLSDQLAVS